MRAYIRPTVTRVDLRIEEAVLTACKTNSSAGLPAADGWLLGGCYTYQSNSGNQYVFACQATGS